MSKTLEYKGLKFQIEIHRDSDMGTPWEESDCYGIVSEWTRRDKRPSEKTLISDRYSRRFYDVQASIEKALRDGWGCAKPEGKTKRQIAAEAVEQDFQRLRAWCNDEWHWVYVTAQLIGQDEYLVPGYFASLCGIESDSDEYLDEVAIELAKEIAARVGDADSICIPVRGAA